VKVFTPDGRPLRRVGKAGGRPWIGRYDPQGMLMPAGITIDHHGKLWVAEQASHPSRVSVWDRSGRLVGDLHGPCYPAPPRGVDLDRPNLVQVQSTLYDVNYQTGAYRCVSTLWRPNVDGWSVQFGGLASSRLFSFRTVRGRTYALMQNRGGRRHGTIFIQDGVKVRAVTSIGYGWGVPLRWAGNYDSVLIDPRDVLSEKQAKEVWDEGRKALRHYFGFWHRWVDRNGDGAYQPDEFQLQRIQNNGHDGYFVRDMDENLTLWARRYADDGVYRIPVRGWTQDGVPLYPSRTEIVKSKPLFRTKTRGYWNNILADPADDRVYIVEREGGSHHQGAKWAAISCYRLDGDRLWSYTKVWTGQALDSPLWKPGLLIGVWPFVGMAKLPSSVGLLVTNGYYGQYHMLSTDGLWVHAFCKDKRYGAPEGPNAQYVAENFSGAFFRNRDNGKCYLVGGDLDARIWEVTGLETIRRAEVAVRLSDTDHALAAEAATGRVAGAAQRKLTLVLARARPARLDGRLDDWDMTGAYRLDAGAGRSARIALAYDDKHLYAAFDVKDGSPMKNSGLDFTRLFKTGDTCDLMLATDPKAEPKRTKAAPGDMRLLFSIMEGKPICVLYEARARQSDKAPKTFTSPVGRETFQRVVILDRAQVAVVRSAKGYTLEAAVALSAIGFTPAPGAVTRGDLGVLFSDAGGSRTIRRVYVANRDTSVTDDIPAEVRLEPAKWATLEAK